MFFSFGPIGIGCLNGPIGLMMQRSLGSVAEYHLYVADLSNHRIQVFNAVDGSHVRCIGQGMGAGPGQLNGPTGCVALLGAEGGISELYVCEHENHRISVFDLSTGVFQRHIGGGRGANAGQLDRPQSIALSLGGVARQGGDHLLYVSDSENHRIQMYNARTGAHVGFLGVGELRCPVGLRLHAATEGRSLLFVSDAGNKRIKIFEV